MKNFGNFETFCDFDVFCTLQDTTVLGLWFFLEQTKHSFKQWGFGGFCLLFGSQALLWASIPLTPMGDVYPSGRKLTKPGPGLEGLSRARRGDVGALALASAAKRRVGGVDHPARIHHGDDAVQRCADRPDGGARRAAGGQGGLQHNLLRRGAAVSGEDRAAGDPFGFTQCRTLKCPYLRVARSYWVQWSYMDGT